jgi:hypothetical protein
MMPSTRNMRAIGRLVILTAAWLAFSATGLLAHHHRRPPVAHKTQASGGTWVCNAYGYGGTRNVWRTITGARSGWQAAAKASALSECRSKLNGCQPSGCWRY